MGYPMFYPEDIPDSQMVGVQCKEDPVLGDASIRSSVQSSSAFPIVTGRFWVPANSLCRQQSIVLLKKVRFVQPVNRWGKGLVSLSHSKLQGSDMAIHTNMIHSGTSSK